MARGSESSCRKSWVDVDLEEIMARRSRMEDFATRLAFMAGKVETTGEMGNHLEVKVF